MSRAVTSSDIQVLKCQPEWLSDRPQPRPGHFPLYLLQDTVSSHTGHRTSFNKTFPSNRQGASLTALLTGTQTKLSRNKFGIFLKDFFLTDNNGTDCGRDKEEEIYITSASVIELDCKKYADNDSYDSGIYNASTNTGNNTDLPQLMLVTTFFLLTKNNYHTAQPC